MKNVLAPSAKNDLMPLRLKTVASAINADIKNKILGPGMTTLIISNEEMKDVVKIV